MRFTCFWEEEEEVSGGDPSYLVMLISFQWSNAILIKKDLQEDLTKLSG